MAIREKMFAVITRVFKPHGGMALDTPVFELKFSLGNMVRTVNSSMTYKTKVANSVHYDMISLYTLQASLHSRPSSSLVTKFSVD
jgi:hypothetical protein